MTKHDPVRNPRHYRQGRFQAIEIIEATVDGVQYNKGAALKYLLRAGRKDDAVQDLRKAAWHALRAAELELARRERRPPKSPEKTLPEGA